MDVMETKKVYGILILSILYVTINVACDPLDFRLIDLNGYIYTGAAIIYPILYVLLDAITRIAGKSMAIRLAILFEISDGIFTYVLYGINLLPVPADFKLLSAFTAIFTPMCRLYLSGIVGSLVAGIADVLIYTFLQKKIKSFFVASTLSTVFIILAHNIPTDYLTFHKVFPDKCWQIITFDYTVSSAIVVFSSFILNYLIPTQRAL